jgi:NDP-sugar pyrophosphorylase family protein
MKAVILAGGKGRRLQPYTTCFPKPLMPIGDRPILEVIIRQLSDHQVDEVIMAVGHLAELLMAFFGDGRNVGTRIRYSREDRPLGTAGCIGQISDLLTETFLMMNGDILTSLDFSDLIAYHKKTGAIATVALNARQMHVDFGVVELDEDRIVGYQEKPVLSYLVSMGIYVFEPEVCRYIAPSRYLDFPDLIGRLRDDGQDVAGYVFDGYWLDIGRPDDYERANRELAEIGTIIPALTSETAASGGHAS